MCGSNGECLLDDSEVLKTTLAKQNEDLAMARNDAKMLEMRCNNLQVKFNQAQSDAKKATDEMHDLKKEHDKLVDDLRKQLEEVSLERNNNLPHVASQNTGTVANAIDELEHTRIRMDSLSGRIAELEANNALLANRNCGLEEMLTSERQRNAENLARFGAQISQFRDMGQQVLQRNQEVYYATSSIQRHMENLQDILRNQ